jgi:hypothetical protein
VPAKRLFGRSNPPGASGRKSKAEHALKDDSRILALSNNPDAVWGGSDVDLFIIGEPSRVGCAKTVATLPMIMASRGDVILRSTPAGQSHDFSEQWMDPHGCWEKIVARATDCPRFDPALLQGMRPDLGPFAAARELDCEYLRDDQQVFWTESTLMRCSTRMSQQSTLEARELNGRAEPCPGLDGGGIERRANGGVCRHAP